MELRPPGFSVLNDCCPDTLSGPGRSYINLLLMESQHTSVADSVLDGLIKGVGSHSLPKAQVSVFHFAGHQYCHSSLLCCCSMVTGSCWWPDRQWLSLCGSETFPFTLGHRLDMMMTSLCCSLEDCVVPVHRPEACFSSWSF